MALVPAYDARTGRKQRQYVPESWFDHPVLGKTVRRTPRSAAAKKKAGASASTATTEAPAAGDKKES